VDGGVAWRRPVEGGVEDLAVAGDTVLAATGGDRVRAFALADGTERWSVRVWEVRRVAPVEGTVFALTRAGRVAALR
jgi:outer membrane protein assembly factor BamB